MGRNLAECFAWRLKLKCVGGGSRRQQFGRGKERRAGLNKKSKFSKEYGNNAKRLKNIGFCSPLGGIRKPHLMPLHKVLNIKMPD